MSKAMELTNLQQLAAAALELCNDLRNGPNPKSHQSLYLLIAGHADDPEWFPPEFKAGDILVKRDDLKIGSDGLRFMGQDGKVRDSEGDYQSKHPECYRLATDAEITCRIHDVRMFAHSQKTALTGQKRKGS